MISNLDPGASRLGVSIAQSPRRSARRRLTAAGFACVVAIALPAMALAAPPHYSVQLISTSNGAAAMNESGTVVGTAASPLRAWVSVAGAPATLLPLPPGMVSSWATDINDLGVVVGAAGPFYSPEFNGKAVAWVPSGGGNYTVQELGVLSGHVASNATAINNLGDVVGFSSNGTYRYPVVFSLAGGVQDLTSSGIFDPADINNQRVLVDHSFVSKTLDLNTLDVQSLGVPGAGYMGSTGGAINESGQVAGAVILTTSTSCDRQAARYTEGIGWEVFGSCGPYNGAQAINNQGDLVMGLNLASYVRFEGIGTYLIEDLIVPDAGHWYIASLSSLAINDARQLVVTATNPGTSQTGVLLLSPIALAGDLDGDGAVNGRDLGLLLGAWGSGGAADLTADGVVDGADLGALLAAWTG